MFEELRAEIVSVFQSAPVKHFTEKNRIRLRAIAEYAEVMERLSEKNMIVLQGV